MATRDGQRGSILLPVILLLMLIATAATAMTLQARTSLREASTRRDRLVLAAAADGAVRAVGLALATAAAAQAAPPFALDGTPQGCRLPGGRLLSLSVQDEGGLVDLNKAKADLVTVVLRRAGLPAPEAAALAAAIAAHRTDAAGAPMPHHPPGKRGPDTAKAAEGQDFVLADELGDLPGVDPALFGRLRPLFTTANRSAGIDPAVAGVALRRLIPAKELGSPAFEALTTPSNHSDFTVTAGVTARSGQGFTRRALFRLDPETGPQGRFVSWDAVLPSDQASDDEGSFCRNVAAAFEP